MPTRTGIFNRCRRIIPHILSHFACNRKNRKVFVFKQCKREGEGESTSCTKNLNSTANRLTSGRKKFTTRLTNVTLLTFVLINASTFRYSSKDVSFKLVNTHKKPHKIFITYKIVSNVGYQIIFTRHAHVNHKFRKVQTTCAQYVINPFKITRNNLFSSFLSHSSHL